MKKSVFGKIAMAMGFGGLSGSFDPYKDVKDKHEGAETPVTFYRSASNGIYIPSRSQRVKSKRLRASNKRQGRV